MMNKIPYNLEERIMDCWGVTSDIRLACEDWLDSPEPMDEDELSNILIGIEYIYNRKFQKLWKAFEDVCDHGGVFLDDDLVVVAKQHRDYNKKLDNMFDDVEETHFKMETFKENKTEIASTEKRWDFSPDEDEGEKAEDEIASSTGKIHKEWRR